MRRLRPSEATLVVALLLLVSLFGMKSDEQRCGRVRAARGGSPEPLPSCAFREPRCTPPPRREPRRPKHIGPTLVFTDTGTVLTPDDYVTFDSPRETVLIPGAKLENGLYVGLHQWGQRDPCQLKLAWNLCRDWVWGDVHYDEQLYIVKIRIHRQGRGGKPFAPHRSLRMETVELGMAEAELLEKNPRAMEVCPEQDAEFGEFKVHRYDTHEVEVDRVDGRWIVGAIVLL